MPRPGSGWFLPGNGYSPLPLFRDNCLLLWRQIPASPGNRRLARPACLSPVQAGQAAPELVELGARAPGSVHLKYVDPALGRSIIGSGPVSIALAAAFKFPSGSGNFLAGSPTRFRPRSRPQPAHMPAYYHARSSLSLRVSISRNQFDALPGVPKKARAVCD